MITYMGKAICKTVEDAQNIYNELSTIPNTKVELDGKMVYVAYRPIEDLNDKDKLLSINTLKKMLSLVNLFQLVQAY